MIAELDHEDRQFLLDTLLEAEENEFADPFEGTGIDFLLCDDDCE